MMTWPVPECWTGGARPGAALRFYWLALRGSYFMSHNLPTLPAPHSLLAAPAPAAGRRGYCHIGNMTGLGWAGLATRQLPAPAAPARLAPEEEINSIYLQNFH